MLLVLVFKMRKVTLDIDDNDALYDDLLEMPRYISSISLYTFARCSTMAPDLYGTRVRYTTNPATGSFDKEIDKASPWEIQLFFTELTWLVYLSYSGPFLSYGIRHCAHFLCLPRCKLNITKCIKHCKIFIFILHPIVQANDRFRQLHCRS